MFLEKKSPESVIATAGNPKTESEQLCDAHFYIGQKLLLLGQRQKAVRHFRTAIETCVPKSDEYAGAKAELNRMGN